MLRSPFLHPRLRMHLQICGQVPGLSHPPCSDGCPLISPKAFFGLLVKVGSTLLVATSIALLFAGPNIEFPCYLTTV
jgi:hypothetical protein